MSASEIARGTKTYRRTTYPTIDATQTSLSTKGKSAVVTGAGQGIGANIARSLVRSGIDYLALMGRRPGPLASVQAQLAELAPECKIFTYTVDIVDEKAVEKGFVDFVADMGGERPIDVLIANAGYMADLGSLDSVDVDDWWKGFEINVKGNFHLLRTYLKYAPSGSEGRQGSVIHVSSSSMHGPYIPEFSSYRASKAGATKLFELYGNEHPEMFVLQIHPGLIGGTEMHSKFSHMTEGLEFDDETLAGDFIVWSLSPEARFLNGRFVHANWDVDELKEKKEEILKTPEMYTIGLVGW
ncbi:hypothetical protein HBI24_079850 [Parastagonospora nodorum]|nr:hypothetical protein HBH52_088700 [Parastagonospora nodorum]KAH4070394.1 hypothetical protein HBH50_098360 [Parastagonospora nodorum]KAH4080823.1 hypothetical protein HBH46_228450 [Parastagonospora nodorum]KAH4090958.1 hypothetical protein HBH48_102140 [Parastagonospora nodorum]KAH4301971.1 hypothetical protein HBI01_095090 [Parastagonospora nodorum]